MSPAPFKAVKRPVSLYEEVLESLKEAVLDGRYAPGEVLPSETELAAQFGVSRPVVREALRSLQSRGFVEIRRGTKGGAVVRDLNRLAFAENLSDFIRLRKVTVDHIFQARLLVEPEVARIAALDAGEADLKAIGETVAESRRKISPERRIQLNLTFHRRLARACGNPLYTILMESLMEVTEQIVLTIKPLSRNLHQDSEHEDILEALLGRNPDKAAERVRAHTARLAGELRELESQFFPGDARH